LISPFQMIIFIILYIHVLWILFRVYIT
jgi:hypothetical protein